MADSETAGASADETLTAWLDGELSPAERAAVEARLAAEPALKARLDALSASNRPYADAFALLLDAAPRERLVAMLEGASPRAQPLAPRRFWMAAAAFLLFAVGVGVGVASHPAPAAPVQTAANPAPSEDVTASANWRQVVAEYLTLTTPATLAAQPDNPALAAAIETYAGKLQLDITPDKLMLPMAMLKDVRLYDFRGKPLVEASYLSGDQMAVAFCVILNGQPDAPAAFEQREGENIVFWSKGGHGYMVAGTAPQATLEALAQNLAARFS